jgi:hypothetical protein
MSELNKPYDQWEEELKWRIGDKLYEKYSKMSFHEVCMAFSKIKLNPEPEYKGDKKVSIDKLDGVDGYFLCRQHGNIVVREHFTDFWAMMNEIEIFINY